MICAWNELLGILPNWMRQEVDRLGREGLQELRLRLDKPPELVGSGGSEFLNRAVVREDLSFCINAACSYSPWSAESTAQGYLTAPGGHRIGLCGDAIWTEGTMKGIRNPTSVCIRVARDFPGIAKRATALDGSILILGSPGSGKTTLLRDLIRQLSDKGTGSVSVVDERGELFPASQGKACFSIGKRTDILTGCGKQQGIDAVLRTMGPGTIAVDEITAEADCEALIHAGWCGVRLLATAHAVSLRDLRTRPVYHRLWECRLFENIIILRSDKSWTAERVVI